MSTPESEVPDPEARGLRLPFVLIALTVVSGVIDAVSYLGLGHVFTANMTGNVVVLGFAAAGSTQFSATHALLSLGTFLVGSSVGGRVGHWFAERSRRTWVRVMVGAETLLLAVGAVIAAATAESSGTAVYALIAVTAVAMGLRNSTVRRLGVPDLTTTVLTMTLTGIASDSPLADGGRTVRRVASVLSLLGGALFGGWLVLRHDLWVPLLIAAGMSGSMALMASGRE